MNTVKSFFKNIYSKYIAKPLLPSTDVQSGLPMIILSKKILKKPKNFIEHLVQTLKNFFR